MLRWHENNPYPFFQCCVPNVAFLCFLAEMKHARNCPIDCASVYYNGLRRSGVYSIMPSIGGMPIEVLCEMDTEGTAGPSRSPRRALGGRCVPVSCVLGELRLGHITIIESSISGGSSASLLAKEGDIWIKSSNQALWLGVSCLDSGV